MDHIKTFQEVKAEDLSKEEISELVNIVKEKYRNVKTPMAENNNIFQTIFASWKSNRQERL
jgi:hypothetical protein